MRKTNKKGFTIVELVVVIAVIAILAAVLIPTFSSLVKKADEASDTAVARNMNNALAEYSALNGKPEDFNEVLDALEEYGYLLANLNAKADGNLYGWDKVTNQIIYIDAEGDVLYKNAEFDPANVQLVTLDGATSPAGYGSATEEIVLSAPKNAAALKDAMEDGMKYITLASDVVMDQEVVIPAGEAVTLDLGGKTYKTESTNTGTVNQTSKYIKVSAGSTLTIQNGTFEGRGVMNNGGTIVIGTGAKIVATDVSGGGCIRNKAGGEVVINGGTFSVPNYIAYEPVNKGGAAVIYNDGGKITVNGGDFTSVTDAYLIGQESGEITINGGNFTSSRGVVGANGGTVNINGGTFTATGETTSTGHVVWCYNAVVNVNAGTFVKPENNQRVASFFCLDSSATTGKIVVKAGVVTKTVNAAGEATEYVYDAEKVYE